MAERSEAKLRVKNSLNLIFDAKLRFALLASLRSAIFSKFHFYNFSDTGHFLDKGKERSRTYFELRADSVKNSEQKIVDIFVRIFVRLKFHIKFGRSRRVLQFYRVIFCVFRFDFWRLNTRIRFFFRHIPFRTNYASDFTLSTEHHLTEMLEWALWDQRQEDCF